MDGRSGDNTAGVFTHFSSGNTHTIEIYIVLPFSNAYAIGWSVDPVVRGTRRKN